LNFIHLQFSCEIKIFQKYFDAEKLELSTCYTIFSFRTILKHNAALIQLPIGAESAFSGIVDLIEERAIYYDGEDGLEVRIEDIPVDMRAEAKERKAELIGSFSSRFLFLGGI
jgi:elongation factor G